jgi:Kef-type K+ transport system membrane component KefB
MTTFAIILAGAALSYGVARWLGLPVLPLLIVSGFVLGRTDLLADEDVVYNILILGVSFLLFVAGTELDPRRIGRQRNAAVRIGLVQFLVLGIGGFAVSVAFGFSIAAASIMALALAASSTLVVVRLLQQRQQMFEPFGRTVLGVLLLQDVLVILLIPIISRLPEGPDQAMAGLGATVLLVALAYVCARYIVPRFLMAVRDDEESLLLGILSLLFVFLGASTLLNLPPFVGAFLAGVALSAFPSSGLVHGQLKSLSDFFTSIFFISLGAVVVIPSAPILAQALVLSVLVLVVTPIIVTLVGEESGMSTRPAIESGLLLAQTSEFSIVIGLQALLLGTILQEHFTIIVLMTVITMILTPFITTDSMVWRLMRLHPLREKGVAIVEPPSGHVLMLGCSDAVMPLLETLVLSGNDVFVVDEDPSVIENLIRNEVLCMRGDISDNEVLTRAGIDRARIVISLARRTGDNFLALERAGEVPVIVRVFEEFEAVQIRERGGIAVSTSDAAAEAFLEWFDSDFTSRRRTSHAEITRPR